MTERYLISPCCNSAIDLSTAEEDRVSCPECKRVFEIREDIDFAEYSTNSTEHFRWSDDFTHIVRLFFENFTLESLEGVAEQIKILRPSERRPSCLLPIFKAMHDCLKKRLQQYLVRDEVTALSAKTKAEIEIDEPTKNLRKLAELLLTAYPERLADLEPLVKSDYVDMLMWLRNKQEHLPITSWPLKSYIHADRTKHPENPAGMRAELTVESAARMLHFCIDFLRMLYDVCDKDLARWHYDELERFRIHCTV